MGSPVAPTRAARSRKRAWSAHADTSKRAKKKNIRLTTERDAQGRPLKVTDPLGHETKYTYDGDGNVETVTDPKHKTTYTYDADNERTKVEEPNKTVTETEYDGAGQVKKQIDGNKHTTKYVRNVLEQVTEEMTHSAGRPSRNTTKLATSSS